LATVGGLPAICYRSDGVRYARALAAEPVGPNDWQRHIAKSSYLSPGSLLEVGGLPVIGVHATNGIALLQAGTATPNFDSDWTDTEVRYDYFITGCRLLAQAEHLIICYSSIQTHSANGYTGLTCLTSDSLTPADPTDWTMDLIYGATPFEPSAGPLLETGTGLAFLAYLPDTSEGLLYCQLMDE